MRKSLSLAGIAGIGTLLASCASRPPSEAIEYVTASDVIDALKQELAAVAQRPLAANLEVSPESCGTSVSGNPSHRFVVIKVNKISADVALKTVATDSLAGTIGASKIPVNVILVSPTLSITRTNIRTQQVTYSLEQAQAQEGTIAAASKEANELTAHTTPNVPFKPTANGYIPVHSTAPPAVMPADEAPHTTPPRYGIAEAVIAARDELIKIDHSMKPCLTPSKLKVEVNFQVQVKKDGKLEVGFLTFVSVSAEAIKQREFAQSLAVTFDLTGSSQALD